MTPCGAYKSIAKVKGGSGVRKNMSKYSVCVMPVGENMFCM